MKLTCESCQAKYAIADEKVAGRNFKIRCKRCGAPLVVRGEAVVASTKREGADAEWYVAVGDRQDGPFDAAQIAEQLASGAIDGETYVWKDGLPDWQPLGEVAELARVGVARAPDLFSPEPSASAFAPPAEPSLTGTRNESSVLFSLSNLKALSTAPASQPAPSAPAPSGARDGAPRATGDGSGLIDIRALAAATAAPASAPSARPVDDLLALGSSAPMLGSPLGAPVLVPAKREGASRGAVALVVGAAGVIVAAAAAVIAVVLATQGDNSARADVPPEPVVASATLEATPAPEPRVESPSVEAPRAEAPRAEEAPLAGPEVIEAAPAIAATPRAPRETERAPRRSPREAPTEERASPAPRQPERRGQRDIGQLIDDAIDPGAPRPRERTAEALPATPSRPDVVGAMGRVAGPVRACGGGARGVVPVRIVFAGATGRVQSAEVIGGSAPPEARSCIARAVREASVPRFTQSTFRVDYPFAL